MTLLARRRRWLSVAAVAAALAVVGALRPRAEASDAPTQRYRDRNWKFSILNFPTWAPIPIESSSQSGASDPLDDCLVAKFSDPKDRGRESPELRLFRMGPNGVPQGARMAGAVTTGESKPPPTTGEPAMGDPAMDGGTPGMDGGAPGMDGGSDPGMDGGAKAPPKPPTVMRFGPPKPKSMTELFDSLIERFGSKQRLEAIKWKDINSRDKVPGKLWFVETRSDESRPAGAKALPPSQVRAVFHVFALWEKEGTETGLWVVCLGTDRKKLEQPFTAIAKSFTWFDPRAEDVESLPILDGLNISASKRREIERTLVSGWDVVVSKKKNYVVVYNTKGRRNDQLARTLAERIEAIREQVYEVQFPPAKPIEAVAIARVCGDANEYHQYGGPGGSAGYWNDDAEELVFYDASPAKEIDDNTLSVLYHEAFHQYIYYSVGNVAPHSWFNEGHGDYYAGAKYVAKKFKIEPFSWRTGVLKSALGAGACKYEWATVNGEKVRKWDRSKGGYSPLEALVQMDQREYYSYPSVSYAQGWGLVYFLREIVPKNPKWNAKWGHILQTYFDTLKAEVNKETPLTPSVPKAGGGDGPGMGEPAMGDGKPAEPAMGDTKPAEPAMGDGKPAEPAMGDAPPPSDPAMGTTPPAPPAEPAMGDSAPADPAKGAPPFPTDPAMGEPPFPTEPAMGDKPADPAMGDPGMGGDTKPTPGGGTEPSDPGIPMAIRRGLGSERALLKAFKAAFDGVDFAELEAAWKSSMSKVNG